MLEDNLLDLTLLLYRLSKTPCLNNIAKIHTVRERFLDIGKPRGVVWIIDLVLV